MVSSNYELKVYVYDSETSKTGKIKLLVIVTRLTMLLCLNSHPYNIVLLLGGLYTPHPKIHIPFAPRYVLSPNDRQKSIALIFSRKINEMNSQFFFTSPTCDELEEKVWVHLLLGKLLISSRQLNVKVHVKRKLS